MIMATDLTPFAGTVGGGVSPWLHNGLRHQESNQVSRNNSRPCISSYNPVTCLLYDTVLFLC
jgi:hypothetical protein